MTQTTTLQESIIKNALRWLDERENTPNKGFKNPEFEAWLRKYGWQTGWAWCCVFVRGVWADSYRECAGESVAKQVHRLFTPNVQATIQQMAKHSLFPLRKEAVQGSLICWQTFKSGKGQITGHIGLLERVEKMQKGLIFHTIEGNTNAAGSREGDRVARKQRVESWSVNNGLRLRGFIHPVDLPTERQA